MEAVAPTSVEELLGVAWPQKTGAVASGRVDIVCVGPTDWLVLTADPDAKLWWNRLDALFQGSAFRATHVSQALTRAQVEGPEVRDLLAKGCALDLHPPLFPPGRSARTRFASMPVIVRCVSDSTFELIVTSSYADYLMAWLEDSQVEFASVP
jgi:sarcosine oxidase subunit gamma